MGKNKNLEEFMTKLVGDEKLLSELQEAAMKDPEKGAYNFALEHSNGEFSEDEFKECIQEVLIECAAKIKEMDESQLENVAGGGKNNKLKKDIEKQTIQFVLPTNSLSSSNINSLSSSVEIEETKGKWNAITAGINSLGSAAHIFDTLSNIWATWMNRKDLKENRKFQKAQAMLAVEKLKAELRSQYGYTDEQIEKYLEDA